MKKFENCNRLVSDSRLRIRTLTVATAVAALSVEVASASDESYLTICIRSASATLPSGLQHRELSADYAIRKPAPAIPAICVPLRRSLSLLRQSAQETLTS